MAALAYPHAVVTTDSPSQDRSAPAVVGQLAATVSDYLGHLSQPESIRIQQLPDRNWRIHCLMFGYQLRVDLSPFQLQTKVENLQAEAHSKAGKAAHGTDLESAGRESAGRESAGRSVEGDDDSDGGAVARWLVCCRIEGNLLRAMLMRISRKNRNDTLIRFASAVHDSLQGSRLVTSICWYWGRPQNHSKPRHSPREFETQLK